LREARHQRRYTLEELAHLTGGQPATIGKMERGESNFTMQSLDKIVRALGISYTDLFDFEHPPHPVRPSNPLIEKTVDYMSRMSQTDQQYFLDAIRKYPRNKK